MKNYLLLWSLILFTSLNLNAAQSYSLAWSEYPSWSVFGVAHEFGIINGKKGEMGPIETKWNIDIVLKEADYDTCIVMYGSNQCDAACLTNMDSLAPSLTKSSVAILPTSTSYGGDACIVTDKIKQAGDLKGISVYGLAKTVSEYTFARNLNLLGYNPENFSFVNMDPGAAALAMQQGKSGFDAIVVWNPFALETLNKNPNTHILFDSTSIEGEIIDMVIVNATILKSKSGRDFCKAIIESFYEVCKRMNAPETQNETLIAIGEKFSHLDPESMKKVVVQTRFYDSAQKGIEVFSGNRIAETMKRVVAFCVANDILSNEPSISYSKPTNVYSNLIFDTTYMKEVMSQN